MTSCYKIKTIPLSLLHILFPKNKSEQNNQPTNNNNKKQKHQTELSAVCK